MSKADSDKPEHTAIPVTDATGNAGTRTGKSYALTVNGAVISAIKTDNAVAADYPGFIQHIITLLMKDKCALEKEANMSGRTIKHAYFTTFGSGEFTNSGDLQ